MPMDLTIFMSRSASSTASRTVRTMRSMTTLGPRSALVLLLAVAISLSCGLKLLCEDLRPAEVDADIELLGAAFGHDDGGL